MAIVFLPIIIIWCLQDVDAALWGGRGACQNIKLQAMLQGTGGTLPWQRCSSRQVAGRGAEDKQAQRKAGGREM